MHAQAIAALMFHDKFYYSLYDMCSRTHCCYISEVFVYDSIVVVSWLIYYSPLFFSSVLIATGDGEDHHYPGSRSVALIQQWENMEKLIATVGTSYSVMQPHLGLIIRIFQAVLNSHKKLDAWAPDPAWNDKKRLTCHKVK